MLLKLCTAHLVVESFEQLQIAFICQIIQDHPDDILYWTEVQ